MKAQTYSQIQFHLVFSVKYRRPLLKPEWRNELFAYMAGIIDRKGHKSYLVNGVGDHVHVLFSTTPNVNLSHLVRDLKTSSSIFINERKYLNKRFAWQNGYSIFAFGHKDLNNLYSYVHNQEQHHKNISFEDEYKLTLTNEHVRYDERFLFDS
ncbi:MAG: hypothetical protein RL220_1060 [Bacteroidota bacterium]|jgi:REP element-mobilizing transposase RayT